MSRFLYFTLFLSVFANASDKYWGKNATEAKFTFETEVHYTPEGRLTQSGLNEHLELQLAHLFGPMSIAEVKAVPKGDHEITILEKKKIGETYQIRYHYEGTIVVEKGPRTRYEVVLPIDPSTIYQASLVHTRRGTRYPCTDAHYNTEGDFWYFWDPQAPGCRLKEGVDYHRIQGTIQRFPNTQKSYPEYDRLVQDGEVTVHVLIGMDEPEERNAPNPLHSSDLNADTYRFIRDSLLEDQFESSGFWSIDEIRKVAPRIRTGLPYVETFTKTLKKGTLRVRLFFGMSGIDQKNRAFHYFLKDALENASVMIYDGHSGLGANLDLETIAWNQGGDFGFQIPKNRYQIYFFNSCSSYPYYNSQYFEEKKTERDSKGSKNLDILTNGLATYFSSLFTPNLVFIKALETWLDGNEGPSYQDIAEKSDTDNLFGISGDEDNPKVSPEHP